MFPRTIRSATPVSYTHLDVYKRQPVGRPVLVDFGLVKLWNPDNPTTHTMMRGVGTPGYAPPEQYGFAAGHTDASSDIYSVGATLYYAPVSYTHLDVYKRQMWCRSTVPPKHS